MTKKNSAASDRTSAKTTLPYGTQVSLTTCGHHASTGKITPRLAVSCFYTANVTNNMTSSIRLISITDQHCESTHDVMTVIMSNDEPERQMSTCR